MRGLELVIPAFTKRPERMGVLSSAGTLLLASFRRFVDDSAVVWFSTVGDWFCRAIRTALDYYHQNHAPGSTGKLAS